MQAISGAADMLFSVAGAPETFGATLLGIAPGAANLTMGSVTIGDGILLMNAAFTGSGNAPTLEGLIGQTYGGENGGQIGDVAGLGGQVAAAAMAMSKPSTAEQAVGNLALMLAADLLPSSGSICGQ